MNEYLIDKLLCKGHNILYHYCDKKDCPYCINTPYEDKYRCNVQQLGRDAVNAIEQLQENTGQETRELLNKINQQPLRLIEPTYSFLRGFYDGIFCEQSQFELDYDYLKGFYEGVKVRKLKNG